MGTGKAVERREIVTAVTSVIVDRPCLVFVHLKISIEEFRNYGQK